MQKDFSLKKSLRYCWNFFKENMIEMVYLMLFAAIVRVVITLMSDFFLGIDARDLHELYINSESFSDSLLYQVSFNALTFIEEYLFLFVILTVGIALVIKLRQFDADSAVEETKSDDAVGINKKVSFLTLLKERGASDLGYLGTLLIHRGSIFAIILAVSYLNTHLIYNLFDSTFKAVYVEMVEIIPLHASLIAIDLIAQLFILYLNFRLIFAVYFFFEENKGVINSLKSSFDLTEGIIVKGILFQILFGLAFDIFVLIPFILGIMDYIYLELSNQEIESKYLTA